jgi:hypothetical protein
MAQTLLEQAIAPVSESLTLDAAKRLLAFKASDAVQSRVEELAELANEGALSPAERSEYESLIAASTMVALLQVKARQVLASEPHA